MGGETTLDDGAPKRDNSQRLQSSGAGSSLRDDAMSRTAPPPEAVRCPPAHASVGCGAISPPLSAPQSCIRSRKPLPAQTTRAVSGTSHRAPACHQRHPPRLGLARALVCLAPSLSHCATPNLSPLASSGVSALLGLEIASWTATDSGGAASPDPSDGQRESDVGQERMANEL